MSFNRELALLLEKHKQRGSLPEDFAGLCDIVEPKIEAGQIWLCRRLKMVILVSNTRTRTKHGLRHQWMSLYHWGRGSFRYSLGIDAEKFILESSHESWQLLGDLEQLLPYDSLVPNEELPEKVDP